MTNTKSTKRALLSSVLALFLCFSMLLGTTFAWFTDSVTSGNNIIQSGNLDIELEYWNGTDWVDVAGKSDILTNELWEPGVTEVAYLRVKNAGSLALKYQLGVNIISETLGKNVNGAEFKLSDYIQFGVVEGIAVDANEKPATYATREDAVAAVTGAKKISAGYGKAASMASGDELYLALVVFMPTTVGNEANHDGVNKPEIQLGINVFATQMTAEEDSFGSDYDKDAAFVSAPVVRPDNTTTDMNLKGTSDVVIKLPAEVINALPAGVEEIGMAVSDPVIEGNTVTFAEIELVDQNGNKIDLDELNLAKDITVTLPLPESAPFAAGDEVVIYHDGVYVATATVDANGKISYDVAHLCEVSVGVLEAPTVNEETNTVEIANVSQFIAFAQSVNAGNNYKGKTVVLTADIDLNNVAWTPIASESNPFKGVFDGGNHTISNLYINEPDADCVALFGFIDTTTIKNFTIKNVNAHGLQQVSAVVGATKPSAVIDNVHVKGDIKIVADKYYAAGIVTHGYVNVTNCSVIADEKGLIDGAGGMVGGICGWRGEGKTVITNCHVKNMDMIGRASIGGLAALIHYNNTISDCSVENVTLTKTRVDGWGSIGALCGNWGGVDKAGTAVYTVTNNTIKDVTLNGTAIKIFSEIYGSKYSAPEADMPLVESGNIFENIKSNLSLVTAVSTATELESALKAGGTVALGKDIALNNSISISNADFVLDGNGYTITMAEGATNTYALFDITGGKATIKNVTFDGINGGAVVRTVDVDFVADNVTAQNCEHTQVEGLFRLRGKNTVQNCTFKNNTCTILLTLNYDGANPELPSLVDNCVFENNTCNSAAVVYYVKGSGATITNNEFVGNKVNCNTNGATVYMGFQENTVVTGNLFKDNTVTDSSDSTRVSGGIFFGYESKFEGNVFINNKAANANGDALGNDVCVSTYYTDIDLSGNYWGGEAPVEGVNYYVQHKSSGNSVIINDYLTTYEQ